MRLINMLGTRCGNLVVLEKIVNANKTNRTYWRCRCDCGNELFAWGPQLRGSKKRPGTTKCHECRDLEFRKLGIDERTPDTLFRGLLGDYRRRAKSLGLEFSLTLDLMKTLTTANCHYCGCLPFAVRKKHSQRLKYNGLDRVDNTLGYTADNVVACCKFCNQAKMNRSLPEFLDWITRVYDFARRKK